MHDVKKFSLHPFQFEDLSPTEFEKSIAFLYQLQGYHTTVCGGAGDQGVDVEARKDGELLVIQCKRFTKTNIVGSPAIQILFAATTANQANKGVIVTTSRFTKQAQQYAQNKPIELIDGSKLDRLAKYYGVGPYWGASETFQARSRFFQTFCQRVGKHAAQWEEEFIEELKLTMNNIAFDDISWIRQFTQQHRKHIAIEMKTMNFHGGLLDFSPTIQTILRILSLEDSTQEALIEFINHCHRLTIK